MRPTKTVKKIIGFSINFWNQSVITFSLHSPTQFFYIPWNMFVLNQLTIRTGHPQYSVKMMQNAITVWHFAAPFRWLQ